MQNSFFKAQLISLNKIKVLIFTDMPRARETIFTLYTDGVKGKRLSITKSVSQGPTSIFELTLDNQIDFGHHYSVGITDFPVQPLDVSLAVYFPEFDEMFNYGGNDLGAIYSKEETKFNIWAPLAADVVLRLENNKGEYDELVLKRTEKGVFRITVKGDLLNRKYTYMINNSGSIRETPDPYGKGVGLDSTKSAVVDTDYFKKLPKIKPTKEIKKPVNAIIYEVGVRDFTEDKNTDIVNKGKYLGFVESGRKTVGGNPAGLDYLKLLGITHVQLNPIIDFRGVKDLDPLPTYNWGYDPVSFFGIEGSYSTDPAVPMTRMKEFREMVDTLHKNNIRVIMDVVYNHIYEYMDSCFERVLPNYFFRRRKDGPISSASGCGDDFATERYMVRKAIVDSIEYFSEYFDVDGYRFDLMGLMDIKTVNQCVAACKKHKQDAIIYGEGWNMGYELPFQDKACSENYAKMPEVGFFNGFYRDVLKGSTFDRCNPGYINGNVDNARLVEFLICGSVVNTTHEPMYLTASQSINYVECHDNATLFDKISDCCPDEDTETKLKRVKLANSLILLSFGVPFLHMGQEIGLTKHGLDNTYNVPKINNMDWKLVDERFDHVLFTKEMIRFRSVNEYVTSVDEAEYIEPYISFDQHICDNTFYSVLKPSAPDAFFTDVILIINPNTEKCEIDLGDDYELIVGPGGFPFNQQKIILNKSFVPPLSLFMLGKRKIQ